MADNVNSEDPESAKDKSDTRNAWPPAISGAETTDDAAAKPPIGGSFWLGCAVALVSYIGLTLFWFFALMGLLAGGRESPGVWWRNLTIICLIPFVICILLGYRNRSIRVTMIGAVVGMLIIFLLEMGLVFSLARASRLSGNIELRLFRTIVVASQIRVLLVRANFGHDVDHRVRIRT
jgi:hypothetical protein